MSIGYWTPKRLMEMGLPNVEMVSRSDYDALAQQLAASQAQCKRLLNGVEEDLAEVDRIQVEYDKQWRKSRERRMIHTVTSIMQRKLETEAEIVFKKVDTLRHVSYHGDTELVAARTLSECVWKTAKKLGE